MTPIGKGANSYPLASYVWAMLYGSTQPECSIASALNDYVYWSQTSSDAEAIADRYKIKRCYFEAFKLLMHLSGSEIKVWNGATRQVKHSSEEDCEHSRKHHLSWRTSEFSLWLCL